MTDEVSGGIAEALEWAKSLTTAAADLREIDDVQIAVLGDGDGWSTEIIDTEQYRAHPRRKKGSVVVRDVPSFIEYVKRHSTAASVAWADTVGGIRCVLNDHEPAMSAELDELDEPVDHARAGWGDHVVTLSRRQTRGFAAWMGHNEKWLTQQQFAEFLEQRLGEIHEPAGADLLEVSQFFQAHTAITVVSARKLQNGQVQMQYTEEIKESGGTNGDTKVPTEFRLVLRPYMDSQPREEGQPDKDQFVTSARLYYRIVAGKVTFMFRIAEEFLLQLEGVHNAAIERVRAETGIPVLLQG